MLLATGSGTPRRPVGRGTRWGICGLLLAVMLVTVGGARASDDGLRIGDDAPRWKAEDLAGERIRFPRDYRDRPVLLLFWATWCPYCRNLEPRLARLQEEFSDTGLTVVAVDFAESSDPTDAIRARGMPFRHVIRGDAIAARYEVWKVPGLFLVEDGEITYVLDYPPPDHPSQKIEAHAAQAKLLAPWWEERIRGVLDERLRPQESP